MYDGHLQMPDALMKEQPTNSFPPHNETCLTNVHVITMKVILKSMLVTSIHSYFEMLIIFFSFNNYLIIVRVR